MHRPPVYHLRKRCVAGLAAAGISAAVALTAAPGAQASFTTGQCQGSNVSGSGSTFQAAAQGMFSDQFNSVFCSAATPVVSYGGGGSGQGRRHMGERTKGTAAGEDNLTGSQSRSYADRFTGSDDPLSAIAKAQIEQGTDGTGDEGQIHQIPVAAGAITTIVNFPNGCDLSTVPSANQTNSSATDGTNRVQFTRAQLERIWYGDSTVTWGTVLPGIAPVSGQTQANCGDLPIKRVVRFDDSGSTYTLKSALQRYNPSRPVGAKWVPDFTSPDTRRWPNSTYNETTCGVGKPTPTAANLVVAGCNGGGSEEVAGVKATDGSIGYVDLATAVDKGLQLVPTKLANGNPNPVTDPNPDTYFTRVENGSGSFTEPTTVSTGYKAKLDGTNASTGGANCRDTVFRNAPSTTLGDWSNVDGTDAALGYGICTLTWDLAFDDNAKAFGLLPNQTAEEQKARTVKDYLTNAVSQSTQDLLPTYDYAKLNPTLLSIAQAGVASIGWNKSGTAGGGSGGGVVSNPGTGTGTGSTPPAAVPAVAKPSNAFAVPSVALSSKDGSATFSVLIPGAGTLKIEPTATVVSASSSAKKKRKKTTRKNIRLGTITRTVSKGGTVKITLKPSGSALAALKKAGSLKVSVKITFTPKGGTARSSTKTITLKYKKPAAKKKATKKKRR